jgi:preprotein translocase subunit SecY
VNYKDFLMRLPAIAPSKHKQTFKQKLKWTSIILITYFILSNIIVWGIDPSATIQFEQLEAIMGASFGSIITLGIGPIVTASIFLQLLIGAGLLKWDTSTHDGKILFQGTQKLLTIILSVVEAFAYVLLGAIQPAQFTPLLIGIISIQIALGGIFILFMDEIMSKYGLGSGVGLFIAAGISKVIIIRLFNPFTSDGEFPGGGVTSSGIIPHFISTATSGVPDFMLLWPIIPTILILVIVIYAESMKVEIPLALGSIRGFSRKWPLKFIYASVIPVIFISAILINLQVWGKLLANKGINLLGTFSPDGQPLSGIAYYLTAPTSLQLQIFLMVLSGIILFGSLIGYKFYKEKLKPIFIISSIIGLITAFIFTFTYYTLPTPIDFLRFLTYMTTMIVGSAIFSVFWVQTANLNSEAVAKQIQNSGMQIPGFRRDIRIIERLLERYIPNLAILGGMFVGFLAAFTDIISALVGGTSLLLTAMILYQLYETIARENIEELYPGLSKYIKK